MLLKLKLVEISNAPQIELLPSLVSGQNACPPEDCGGAYRYREIIEILTDPTHEGYQNIFEWFDPKSKPIVFKRLTIKKELRILGAKIKGYEKEFKYCRYLIKTP